MIFKWTQTTSKNPENHLDSAASLSSGRHILKPYKISSLELHEES